MSSPSMRSAVAFDISDLLDSYRRRPTPGGIQRVQQELCLEMLTREDADLRIIIYDRGLQNWRMAPREWLLSLFAASRRFRSGEQLWEDVFRPFAAQLASFPSAEFAPGTWLVNAGTSWAFAGYFIQLRQLRRLGTRFAVLLHDCIPERHPEYFEPAMCAHHSYWLSQIRECADLVICNSQATKRDYLELATPRPAQQVRVCPLNGNWRGLPFASDAEAETTALLKRLGIAGERFMLAVGTIEPRKNHLTLLRVWNRLRERGGSCPKLLCIGRIGWNSEPVLEEARARGLLDPLVFFLSDVSDDALRALYGRCSFTLYISSYEGWGLPVSESLAAGKVCIAGNHAALVEAGAGLATHVDPQSEAGVADAVVRLLANPALLASEERRIRASYRPGTWHEVAADICATLRDAPATSPPQLPQLQPFLLYRFGREQPVQNFAQPEMAEPFCAGRGWHQWEGWGTWTRRETAELAFRLRGRKQLPKLLLGLTAPPGGTSATIALNDKALLELPHFEGETVATLDLPLEHFAPTVQEIRIVRLKISAASVRDVSTPASGKPRRAVGLGFRFIAALDPERPDEARAFLKRLPKNASA